MSVPPTHQPETRNEPKSLLILGTHMLAEEIADLVSEMPDWRVAGFVENLERKRCAEHLLDLPVHWIDTLCPFAATHHAICGISTTKRAHYVAQVAAVGLPFATLVHPSSRVSRASALGEGTFLSSGVIVATSTRLGRHVFVNRGALIGHHTTIGDFTTVQPGANIGGDCHLGEDVYIAMGAIVLPHVKIGSGAVVGAGSVVTKDVPEHVQVVGVPARIVKQDIESK